VKRSILATLIFTGVWAAMWDTPEADLSLARLHITTPAGSIQNRPRFLVNVSGITSLTSLYLEDTASERTSSLPIINGYPEAQVSLRFGRFELGLSGEQILDAGGEIWEHDSLGDTRNLDIYRLSAEAAWWPSQRVGLVLGYNHYLSQLSWDGIDSIEHLDSTHYKAFGHAPGFSFGFVSAHSKRLTIDALVLIPHPLSFEGYLYASNNKEKRNAVFPLPLTLIGDLNLTAIDQFNLFLSINYVCNSVAQFILFEYSDSILGDSIIPEIKIPLYDKNTVIVKAGAGYRIIPPLNLRLWGKYSSSPVDELRLAWPNPGGISLAAQGIWEQGVWRFSAEVGTRRFHPILSEKGTRLEGNSYHLRIGLGLVI